MANPVLTEQLKATRAELESLRAKSEKLVARIAALVEAEKQLLAIVGEPQKSVEKNPPSK